MIEGSPFFVGGGAGAVGLAALYLWRLEKVARWAKMLALVLVVFAAGAVVGVVDVERLLEILSYF